MEFTQERFEGLNKHLNKYESEGITEIKYGKSDAKGITNDNFVILQGVCRTSRDQGE